MGHFTVSKPGEPTQRQLRVGEEIRHVLSMVLAKKIVFEDIPHKGIITVTEVQISPDLKNARAFIMTLGGEDLDVVVAALNEHARQYRHEVAQCMNIKFMPRLKFKPDLSYLQAQRVESLLRTPHVAQDLAALNVTETTQDDDCSGQ